MWALEYDPDLFSMYEDPELSHEKSEGSKGKNKSKQVGKYGREYLKSGAKGSDAPLPISVFLVASVLKDKSSKLQQEARGLDDVVKVSLTSFYYLYIFQGEEKTQSVSLDEATKVAYSLLPHTIVVIGCLWHVLVRYSFQISEQQVIFYMTDFLTKCHL